jgi:hypothetical protein
MNQYTHIPYDIKQKCVALKLAGKNLEEIYAYYVSELGSSQSIVSFRVSLNRWVKKVKVDEKIVKDQTILHDVNLALEYKTNKATVQYNPQTQEIERVWARIDKNKSSINQLIEAIKEIQPIQIKVDPVEIKEKRMLEIPLFDSHFGVSDYEYYKSTQAKIMDKLLSRKWEEVLIILGQDLLHTDNFKGQTANGTQIGEIDLVKAWNDAHKFYAPIIELSLKQGKKVKVIYSPGNHDHSMSWAFVQFIKALYPQVNYDDSLEERKVHTFGECFVGVCHGDKNRKNLHNIFPIEFPVEWSKAKTRELHFGHWHVEDAKDVFGMMVRTLATRNKTDKWHKTMGFIGAHKRFMLFEFSEQDLESIHYV